MNSSPIPDTFYLVVVAKPDASDPIDRKQQAWTRFLASTGNNQKMSPKLEKLAETCFLFHGTNNVLLLHWFLGCCETEAIEAKVFLLQGKPELCA